VERCQQFGYVHLVAPLLDLAGINSEFYGVINTQICFTYSLRGVLLQGAGYTQGSATHFLYCLNCTEFGKLILRKIIETVATRFHSLKLKCTKFDFDWASARVPIGELTVLPDPSWI